MKTKLSAKGKTVLNYLVIDNAGKLTKMLNEALSEEWLTYYQCWIGAILMEGPMRNEIKPELFIHANQELNHALLIKARMLELGIAPDHNPSESKTIPRCQMPMNPYIEEILNQNLENESSAIQRYRQIADYTFGKDQKTHQLAIRILNEELQHAQNIEKWLNDIQLMKMKLNVHSRVDNYAIKA